MRKYAGAFSVLPTSQRDRQSRECRIPKTAKNYTQLPAVAWKSKEFQNRFPFLKNLRKLWRIIRGPWSRSSLYSSAESAQRMGLKGSRSQKTHSLRENRWAVLPKIQEKSRHVRMPVWFWWKPLLPAFPVDAEIKSSTTGTDCIQPHEPFPSLPPR